MSTDDDERAIDRFIAGAPVDADALASAITAKAFDRAVVIESLLQGLAAPEPVVRRRAAERIARMPDVDGRVEVELRRLAEQDDNERVRAACAAALAAHAPDAAATAEAEPATGRRWSVLVLLKAATVRSR